MTPKEAMRVGFFDELEKIAISLRRLRVSKFRKGRRPMRVSTFLRKEKEGTLYKHSSSFGTLVPYAVAKDDPGAARPPRRRGDVPSKEDPHAVRREDGRESAHTVPGVGAYLTDISVTSPENS